jgi:hypothetical protein
MPQALTLQVRLPSDRSKTGTLSVIDPVTGGVLFGPIPVLGRAARTAAAGKGNPSADWRKPYGDTPLGEYRIARIVENGAGTTRSHEQYGRSGSIVLDPTGGDAALAKANGRTGLLIHAGRQPQSPTPLPSHLKSTNGCLRVLDGDLSGLIAAIRANSLLFPGTVRIEVGPAGPPGDIDDSANEPDPPPTSGGGVILP